MGNEIGFTGAYNAQNFKDYENLAKFAVGAELTNLNDEM